MYSSSLRKTCVSRLSALIIISYRPIFLTPKN
jgi:hypothetical protein